MGWIFRQITIVQKVDGQILEITSAVETMSVSTSNSLKSIASVVDISKMTAEKSESVSAAVQEAHASMEEIAASTQYLSKTTDELQDKVSVFVVK